MMSIIDSFKNTRLLIFILLVTLYFYFMINNFFTGNLSPIAALIVFIIVTMGLLLNISNKSISRSNFLILLSLWMYWSLLLSLLYFTSFGQLSSSILWLCTLFCSYSFVKNVQDLNLIIGGSVCICIYALYLGMVTLNIGNYIGIVVNSNLELNQNIAIFPMITLPIIMLINNKIIKWGLLLLILIVILLTLRRTATLCMIFVLVINIIQEVKTYQGGGKLKRYMYSFMIIVSIVYVIYNLLIGTFAELFEHLLLRFNSIGDDGGSGRMAIYENVWDAFWQGNFGEYLIGHGYLGVNRIIHHTAAHNDLLEYLFDYGIIGVFFYLFLNVCLIKKIILLYRIRSLFIYSYMVSYGIFFLYGMLGNIIVYPQYFLLLPIYWGVVEKCLKNNIKII